MKELAAIFQLFRCCRAGEWLSLGKYLFFKAFHHDAQVVIPEYHSWELRDQCAAFLLAHHFALEEDRYLLIGRPVPSAQEESA